MNEGVFVPSLGLGDQRTLLSTSSHLGGQFPNFSPTHVSETIQMTELSSGRKTGTRFYMGLEKTSVPGIKKGDNVRGPKFLLAW